MSERGEAFSAGDSGTTVESLLAALARLPHGGRMRVMAAYGRSAGEAGRTGALRRDVLSTLEKGDVYQRLLALQACYGSRDGARVLRALTDPSRTVRGRALPLAVIVCDDGQLAEGFGHLASRRRSAALRMAVERGRWEPVDAFLARLEATGDPGFLNLMPYGSEAFVRPRLERARLEAGVDVWAKLGRRHPRLAAGELARWAADSTDPQQVRRVGAAVPHLARQEPDLALELLGVWSGRLPLTISGLDELAARRPQAVADLIGSRPDDAAPQALLLTLAARLGKDAERLAAVTARLGVGAAQAPGWLRRLPPTARRTAYGVAARAWRDQDGALSPEIAALLPTAEREAEARRNWALPVHQTRPRQQLRYAGLLAFDEARERVAPFLRNPDAELRGAALAALAHSIRYSRSRLPQLFALMEARANEQDPVRLAMLGGLAALPPLAFTEASLPALTAIFRQALNATDLSPATAQAMERLALRLIARQPAWAVATLATLMQERGALGVPGASAELTEEDVRRLAPAVAPVLRAWSTREREHQIVAFAGLIGRRLEVWDALADELERLVLASRTAWVSMQALQLIARHRRERMPSLVPRLLQHDRSWITQGLVQQHLHLHRQDLLDPFLGRKAWRGRFSTGRTRYVLPFRQGFARWLPGQQRVLARTLAEVIADGERDTPAVLGAIDQLAALPAVSAERLIALAAPDDPRLAARDRALQALARRDGGDGLDTLIGGLGDARARIAVYALRAALAEAPEERVIAVLRAAPLDRVTVAKEVVRLAGDQAGEGGYAFLLDLHARESGTGEGDGLHRDVRVALLRALWSHLEKDASWPILQEAAASADPVLAAGLVWTAAPHLSRQADGRLSDLMATLLARPEPALRLDVLKRLAAMPPSDARGALTSPILQRLGSDWPDEITAAASALIATRASHDAAALEAALRGMLANRRALLALTTALVGWLSSTRAHAEDAARAVIRAMSDDPLTVALRVEIGLAALAGPELVEMFVAFADQDALHAGVLTQAASRFSAGLVRREAAVLETVRTALGASRDERLRRLALAALVGLASARGGWTDDRVAELQGWRKDPSPMVAEAAQFTFVAN